MQLKLCGAEIVWPKPIGSGVSTVLYDCISEGRNFARGTARIALITFGECKMPCFIRLSTSFSQSVFSKSKHQIEYCERCFLTYVCQKHLTAQMSHMPPKLRVYSKKRKQQKTHTCAKTELNYFLITTLPFAGEIILV